MRRIGRVVPVLLVLVIGFGLGRYASKGPMPTPAPPILEKVQSLGELHTARFNYQNVFDFETAREPEEWVRYVPGGASLVQASTRNRALFSSRGYVEAGVDLREAKLERTRLGYRVLLPKPKVYEPNVRAWAVDVKRGFLWRDDNITTKATDDAKQRLREAALRQGIRQKASEEARQRVTELLAQSGQPVEVVSL